MLLRSKSRQIQVLGNCLDLIHPLEIPGEFCLSTGWHEA
jgi:hypothetical protein